MTRQPPQGGPAEVGGSWRRLYRAGGVAAALYVVLVLVPVVLVFVAPVPPVEGRAVLEYIADHKALYLTELVCFVGLAVPALIVFAALAVAVWPVDKSIAALGGLFGIASEGIALALGSSPQSLHGGLVVLSNAYVHDADETRRAGLVSAADALIAATNAVSWAGTLTAGGILVLSLLIRRAGFGTAVAVIGLVAGALGIVCETLRPLIGPAYLLYGLLLPTWFAVVGWNLLRLSRRDVARAGPAGIGPSPQECAIPAPGCAEGVQIPSAGREGEGFHDRGSRGRSSADPERLVARVPLRLGRSPLGEAAPSATPSTTRWPRP